MQPLPEGSRAGLSFSSSRKFRHFFILSNAAARPLPAKLIYFFSFLIFQVILFLLCPRSFSPLLFIPSRKFSFPEPKASFIRRIIDLSRAVYIHECSRLRMRRRGRERSEEEKKTCRKYLMLDYPNGFVEPDPLCPLRLFLGSRAYLGLLPPTFVFLSDATNRLVFHPPTRVIFEFIPSFPRFSR